MSKSRRHGRPVASGREPATFTLPSSGRLPCAVEALLSAGVAGAAVMLLALGLAEWLALSAAFVPRVAVLVAFTVAGIVGFAVMRLAPAPFGPANRITTVRAVAIALLAAFVGEAAAPATAWVLVGFAIALLVLDGVDGRLARRRGCVTVFGARFDMETDAALTLVLAVLCWQFGKAGVWILAIGLMRYGFVAAAWLAPCLARPLPYSRRRQTICVLGLAGLLAVLSPLIPVPASSVAGVLTLALLSASFAIDLAWLARHRPRYG